MNQRKLARGLGIDPAAVSRLKSKGMPVHSVEAAAAWRRENVAPYVRMGSEAPASAPTPSVAELAAPSAGMTAMVPWSRLDLGQERAALAREQRVAVEMRNAITRGEYAPIALLGEVLACASQAVADGFDRLPSRLKKSCPDLPPQAMEEVLAVIAIARNEWVRDTAALVVETIFSPEDDAEDAP